jgi:hypothetical protein
MPDVGLLTYGYGAGGEAWNMLPAPHELAPRQHDMPRPLPSTGQQTLSKDRK